jgi:nitrite reductase (NO-forming)
MTRAIAFVGAFLFVMAVTIGFAALATTAQSGGGQTSGSPAASGSHPASSTPAGGPPIGEIEITAFDLGFEPATIDVEQAGVYTLTLVNTGGITHDITLDGGQPLTAEAGQSASMEVTVPEGGIGFVCSIPGHADGGMRGSITVAGEGPDSGGGHGGPAVDTDVEPDPDAPPYELYDATAPALLEGEVHDIDLVIEEREMTVAEGYVQKVWTFNGTVPGPVIRVKVGDTIRIHLSNPDTSEVAHSVDFHSSQVAWNDEMTSIEPGEEKLYEWTAEYAGVWMYHCGTSPALHHIANGMYGMVIVEPAEGLPPVDAEFAVVQSEWYLGPQKDVSSLEKASASAPAPDFVLFNGVSNQYVDNPIQIGTGERVRVFVLNAGPSVDSSFHVVGTIFDSVTKEGVQLVPGNPGSWGSQAMDLAPAQGGIVEFVAAEDGLYPMVTHAFNFVGRGALGLFQAGDGDPLN